MNKAPGYVIISLVFFILIGVGLAYSYFFYPNTHPIECAIKAKTGKDCPTCGFSRSFSHFTHFQFSQGKNYNALSLPVFLFFLIQFFIRGAVVFYFLRTKKLIRQNLIKIDILISISLFLLAFLPIILKF